MAPRHERAGPGAPPAGATPALIRWGAVIGGGIIGLSLLALLAALWLALAYGTGAETIQSNLDWFITLSAVVALFVGGLLAGWLSGVPGFAPGLFNGLAVWAVVLTISLVVGTPGAMQTMQLPSDPSAVAGQALWAAFAAMLIGALAAALGGGTGGMMTRPAFVYAAPEATGRRTADRAPRDQEPGRDGDARRDDEARATERPAEDTRIENAPRDRRTPRDQEEAPTNGGSVRGGR